MKQTTKRHRLGARTYGVPFGGSGFPSLWAWLFLVFGVKTSEVRLDHGTLCE